MSPRRAKAGAVPAPACVAAALAFGFMSLPGQAAAGADLALGEHLAAECAACHQPSGRDDGIPGIVGWRPETFVAVLGEYRSGARTNPVMAAVASRLSPEEMAALAAWFGTSGRN